MIEILEAAVGSGLVAAGFSLSSWLKSGEKFEVVKFTKSIVLAFFVGTCASLLGVEADIVVASPIYAGLSLVLENLLKAVVRRAKGSV